METTGNSVNNPFEAPQQKNFIKAAGIAGAIMAVVTSALLIANGYSIMNATPDGSPLPPGSMLNGVICLLSFLTSFIAVKLHASEEPVMQLGRGAIIGLVSGALAAIVGVILQMGWEFADPNYTAGVMDAMTRWAESVPQFSEEQVDEMLANMEDQYTMTGRLKAIGIGLPINAVANAVTGLLAAKIFTSRPPESL
jgi:hypothetical protein